MFLAAVLVIVGLILLTFSADRFVVSAARLARAWGMSPILIGALVIGMGTSAPEFLVSLLGGRDSLDLAVGNIIGSNVANLTLVLGSTALVLPIYGQLQVLRREGMLMLAGVVAFAVVAGNGLLGRVESAFLILGMAAAAAALARWARLDARAGRLSIAAEEGQIAVRGELLVGLGALLLMLIGAELLKNGALDVAERLGLTEGFVGLTVVAVGTSLPELATALAAARRHENELVVGNVLGSNLFNSLAVAGTVGVVFPGSVTAEFGAVLLLMILVATFAGALMATGNRLVRWEGLALLAVFVGFLPLAA